MNDNSFVFNFILLIIAVFIYLIPSIVAGFRNAKQSTGIVILNLLLGWTILGWIGSLIWAFSSPKIVKYKFVKSDEVPTFEYTCEKCGFKKTFEQSLKLYLCPQCNNENKIDL